MSGYNQQGSQDGGAFGNRDSGYTSGHSLNTNYDNRDNPQSSNAGPHSSNLLNKADPRVDSDRDNRGTGASYTGNTGGATHSGYGGNQQYDNPRSTNTGPHDSSAVNRLDPRVDSDRDNRGARAPHSGSSGGTTHSGYGGNQQYDNPRSTNSGPHDSSALNKLDPRVDSDRDHRGVGGGYTTGNNSGNTTGGNYGSTTGQHHHNPAGTSTGNYGTNTSPTYGNQGNTTTGPHNSALANKLDPRVDSNRTSPSSTGQGQNTYGTNNPNTTGYGTQNQNTTGFGNSATQPNQISSTAEGHGNGALSGKGSAPATANASVMGAGPTGSPEGQASASGPTSANASTTTSSNPITRGINKLAGRT